MSSLKYLTCKHQSINESIPRFTFEGLGGELFILVGDHVDAERELIDARLFTTQVVNTDLGIGDTPEKGQRQEGKKEERKAKESEGKKRDRRRKEESKGQWRGNKGREEGKEQEMRNRKGSKEGDRDKEERRERRGKRKLGKVDVNSGSA